MASGLAVFAITSAVYRGKHLTEQFDGVFIADLTGRGDQKAAIWGIYTQHYDLDRKQARLRRRHIV